MVLVHVKLILWFYDMQLVWMLLPENILEIIIVMMPWLI
jgi:hypothetical protein